MATGRQLHVGSMVTSSNSELGKHIRGPTVRERGGEGEPVMRIAGLMLLLNGVQDSPHVLVHFQSLQQRRFTAEETGPSG